MGFIDSTGTTVIPTIYHNAFDFKEGLAAVRENELYGFIDASGKYVLAPQFDYATYFENGITLVYKQRQPYFIDKTGKVILPTAYRSIEFITPSKAVIATKSKRYGIIDIPANRLLLDTLYSHIHFFNSGVTVVNLFDAAHEDYGLRPRGVIDTAGNFIVPIGKYDYIGEFHNGFADITIDSINRTPGTIDATGRLINKEESMPLIGDVTFPIPYGYYTFHSVSSGEQIYEGLISPKGDTILNNPSYKSVSSFSCNRIVVEDHNENYFILDRHAKPVCNKSFDDIKKFFKNYAIVKSGGCYGIIDTTGKFVIPATYEDIAFPDSTADHFFFGVPDGKNEYTRIYGLANMKNQAIVQPGMDYPEKKAFVNGLFNTMVNYQSTYYNQQGKIVWQDPIDQEAVPLNIDYLGYSQYRDYPETLIKLNNSDSSYVELLGKLITTAEHLPNNKFIFQFDTTQGYASNGFKTYKLIVGNSTNEAIKLLRISGLIILLEALDEDGAWKKIQIIGYPTHTNGYDDIILNPGKFWPFIVAQYGGGFPTKLRAALWYLNKNEKVQTIYSNVINTNINRSQFWREYDYPRGVSDPHRWNPSIDLSTIKRDNWGQWDLPDL